MWWNMDVYVIYPVLCVDIYVISLFVLMESKKPKNSIFPLFAECHTRQRGLCRVPWPWHSAKLGSRDPISQLCRVPEPWHSAKIFFKKKKFLCRVQEYDTRQRIFKKKEKILCRVPLRWHSTKRPSESTSDFFCRMLTWHSIKALPSARYVALGKETFADGFFADCSLPSAALGKAFAECNRGFAECLKHSAKSPCAVVICPCHTNMSISDYLYMHGINLLLGDMQIKD